MIGPEEMEWKLFAAGIIRVRIGVYYAPQASGLVKGLVFAYRLAQKRGWL